MFKRQGARPLFLANAASKGFSFAVSPLFATFCGEIHEYCS
jgi:hypothetical protein